MNPRLIASFLLLAGSILLKALTDYEGNEYRPYKDVVSVVTVCRGHTGKDIIWGKVYSEQECNDLLVKDVTEHGKGILACITVPLAQTEYNSYTSLSFNIGVWNFCHSTLVKKLNKGDYVGACGQILQWDKGGKPLRKIRGLTIRRNKEYVSCIAPAYNQRTTFTVERIPETQKDPRKVIKHGIEVVPND